MIVLIADGIIIVIMIMIGKMTEAIAEKANKEMTTIPKIKEGKTGTVEIKEGKTGTAEIKEGKIGTAEIKEEAIQKTADTQMTGITSPQTGATETVSEMIATGNMIATSEEIDIKVK